MKKYKEYYDAAIFLEIFLEKSKLSEEKLNKLLSEQVKEEILASLYEIRNYYKSKKDLSKNIIKILNKLFYKENCEVVIEVLNEIVFKQQEGIYYLLKKYLNHSPKVDWQEVIKKLQKQIPKPKKPKEPDYPSLPPKPKFGKLYEKLFPSRKQKKLEEWYKKCEEVKKEIEKLKNEYQQKLSQWEEWEKKQEKITNEILNLKKSFQNGEPAAIEKYFQWIIEESPYPWEFQKILNCFLTKKIKFY